MSTAGKQRVYFHRRSHGENSDRADNPSVQTTATDDCAWLILASCHVFAMERMVDGSNKAWISANEGVQIIRMYVNRKISFLCFGCLLRLRSMILELGESTFGVQVLMLFRCDSHR